MIRTYSAGMNAFVIIDIAGHSVPFGRSCGNPTDAAVIAAAAKEAIQADQNDMVNRYNERNKEYYHALRRISALKARITKLKRGQK